MQVKLCFREISINGKTDVVPYLWDASREPTGDTILDDITNHDLLVRELMGASSRTREIHIVESREAAMAISALNTSEGSISIITNLGESWAVGSTRFDGSYDGVAPEILDLRRFGPKLEFDPGLTLFFRNWGDVGTRIGEIAAIEISTSFEPEMAP